MKLSEIKRTNPKELTSFEIEDPSTGDYVEVEVFFEYDIEPAEYEDGQLFHPGGADCTNWILKPFKYDGKMIKEVTPEMVDYVHFDQKFLESDVASAKKLKYGCSGKDKEEIFDEYMVYLFNEHVAPNIEIPRENYPGRY